jgi:hypothetical protein
MGNSFGSNSVELQLSNDTDIPQEVDVPTGTTFPNSDPMAQPLIVSQGQHYALGPGESRQIRIDGYCGASSMYCPSPENSLIMPAFVLGGGVGSAVLLSQLSVWSYLDQFVPGSFNASDGLSSREYKDENPEEFEEFDEKYHDHAAAAGREFEGEDEDFEADAEDEGVDESDGDGGGDRDGEGGEGEGGAGDSWWGGWSDGDVLDESREPSGDPPPAESDAHCHANDSAPGDSWTSFFTSSTDTKVTADNSATSDSSDSWVSSSGSGDGSGGSGGGSDSWFSSSDSSGDSGGGGSWDWGDFDDDSGGGD